MGASGDTRSTWLWVAAGAVALVAIGSALRSVERDTGVSKQNARDENHEDHEGLTVGTIQKQRAGPEKAQRTPTAGAASDEQLQRRATLRSLLANPQQRQQQQLPSPGSDQGSEQATPEEDPVAAKVQAAMKRAMWDLVAEDAAAGRFERLLALLAELKQRLARLTPNRRDLLSELDAVLDLALIEQMLQHADEQQAWDLHPLGAFVVGRVRMLEAPVRNAETDKWAKEHTHAGPPLQVLRELLDFAHGKLDQLDRDAAAACVRGAAPVLERHGRERYREMFASQVPQLPRTEAWAAAVKARHEGTLAELHRAGVLDLVFDGPGPIGALPETLEDAAGALNEARGKAQRLWRLAYTVVRLRGLLAGDSLEEVTGILLARQQLLRLSDSPDGRHTLVVRVSEAQMARASAEAVLDVVERHTPLESTRREALFGLLDRAFGGGSGAGGAEHADPAMALLDGRLRGIIEALVVPNEAERRRKAEETERQVAGLGLGCIRGMLLALAQDLGRLCDLDMALHGETAYKRMLA